jgi:drug/metabolite transporter (DMT)-like permease
MKARIWTAMIAVYIAWGSTYLAIRFAVETMPPFLMAAIRFLIAGGILFAWRRMAGDVLPTSRQWKSAAIIGLFLLLGGNGGVVWAEQRVVSGVAALVVGASPLWMVLLDAIRPGGKRPGWQTWLGVLWGFGGIALLVGPAEFSGNGTHLDLAGCWPRSYGQPARCTAALPACPTPL